MNETQAYTKLKRLLAKAGIQVRKLHGSRFSGRGLPDLLVWRRGCERTLFLEIKLGNGRVTAHQARLLYELPNAFLIRYFKPTWEVGRFDAYGVEWTVSLLDDTKVVEWVSDRLGLDLTR